MHGKIKYQPQSPLFFSLESTLNQKYPLFILSHKVNWEMLEGEFSPLYCHENGRPAKPIRLMVGLLILKHLRKLSDESVVEQWDENIYYQYFCGQQGFLPADPCVASELVHFLNRAGEKGIEAIRLVRAVERKLGEKVPGYQGRLELFKWVLAQKRNDKNKIYSLHEPQVCCISKGRGHKLYELGNKAPIGWTSSGVILSALGFRNKHDGHTLDKSIGQVERPRQSAPENGIADKGYRGRNKARETAIHIPKAFSKAMSACQRRKKRKIFRKRAGIEPVTGHLKSDHRLSRNFYKGTFGDNINVMLAPAVFNFKKMMNKWKTCFRAYWEMLIQATRLAINLIAVNDKFKNVPERFFNTRLNKCKRKKLSVN